MTQPDFDICVIGGGPAGASMGAYLARAGVKVCVFERELFPRPHVGESLVPSSTRVFKDLNFLDKMEEAKFPRKYGAVWTSAYSKGYELMDLEGVGTDCNAAIRFEERTQEGVDRNYTYHVDRGKFDLMLLQHANELGSAVYEGVKVESVDFSEPLAKVRYTMGRGHHGVTCRMVVDASVPISDLGRYLGTELPDEGDYHTLGGFVVARFGRVPEVGATLSAHGLDFVVREGDERRVTKVEIQRQGPPQSIVPRRVSAA